MTAQRSSSARAAKRVEFGDWQTPLGLAQDVLAVVRRRFRRPRSILEPTCGEGAFLVAATAAFPAAKALGFDVSRAHVAAARESLAERATVRVGDFFELEWERVLDELADPLLIVGNPPWVTNSALGKLDAFNLPEKSNFKRHSGFEAMTGASNFDISEWMLIRLLELVRHRRFAIAMLCKASVARRVIQHAAANGWSVAGEIRAIDARAHFSAAVDAVLLHVWNGEGEVRWPVYGSLQDAAPERSMGVVDGCVVGDIDAYEASRSLAGRSEIEWRSGIKHDCAKVMELAAADDGWKNGLGESVDIERSHVYPLLKGSDIANGRLVPRRRVILTQRVLGEDTQALRDAAPRLWKYLHRHRERLEARKSSIYAKQPVFSMFGIGEYSFAPYKVAICGLYKRLTFAVIRPHQGQPVMVDDTAYFLPFDREEEAEAVALALNGSSGQEFFLARVFWDAKRPINKALLQSLSLEALLQRCRTARMSEDEYERLWEETASALEAAADADDEVEVLRLIDAWIARWRNVESIPHASRTVSVVTWGPVWTTSSKMALAYAREAAALADRAQDPTASNVVGWVVKAHADVTEMTERVEHTRAAAEAARRYAQRVARPRPKIDAHLARALRNLVVDVGSLGARLALVEEIRQLSARHAGSVLDIDEHLAAAIHCLGRPLGRGTAKHMQLVDELAILHQRWPTSVEIAGVYVAETWNAYTTGGLVAEPEQLLARIESIHSALPESHASIEQALTYLRAELARK